MNKARVKIVLLALLVFLVVIQIFQPARTNPAAVPTESLRAHVRVPKDVYGALLRSCGDCHTNQTRWPSYSKVAPLSWVIVDDVNQGRRHMNFEDWEGQADADPKQANERLIDICQEIRKSGMPPFSYRLLHKDLQLNQKEVEAICAWSDSFRAASEGTGSRP